MKWQSIFMHSFFLRSVFTIAVFMLFFISSLSFKHNVAISISTDLLVHSYKIQIQLEQVLSSIKDAETGHRGYLITHDTVFLQPYIRGWVNVNKSFDELKHLTINQPGQKTNLKELHDLIDKRFNLMANSLTMVSNSESMTVINQNMFSGRLVMDDIRSLITKMIDLEMTSFIDHKAKYNDELSITPFITLLLLLFTLLIFILSFIKINRDLNILKNSNDKLMITTESIKHAEVIGEFCISIWDLKTNKLIFSDNLFRLLGCEPHSFEPTLNNFLQYVHPDDRHIVALGSEKILREHHTYPRFYRIIRKDGAERFFNATGKFISDDESTNTHISVVKDITQQHINDLIVKERNRELEQSIKELASFNQIASHDLQEPLRKIQTFISRISDVEILSMSDTGKEYFMRVQTSVGRMRKLIDDLLLFSRTSKIEKAIVETDLNLVIQDTIYELSPTIEEKNAEIQTEQMPILRVIPFQIHQLFQNLLGNSLKYSKSGVRPVIKIGCEKVSSEAYPFLKTSSVTSYYKIFISDNGLGFDQKYAGQIFTIFKRLHTSDEYPGTGIGLSICKKIVEIHSGYILAEGNPGIGSIFTIFLPAV